MCSATKTYAYNINFKWQFIFFIFFHCGELGGSESGSGSEWIRIDFLVDWIPVLDLVEVGKINKK
jgi:hypothetical protein